MSFIRWGTVAVVGRYYCKSPFPAALSLVTLGVWEVVSARWPGQQGALQLLMPKSQGNPEDLDDISDPSFRLARLILLRKMLDRSFPFRGRSKTQTEVACLVDCLPELVTRSKVHRLTMYGYIWIRSLSSSCGLTGASQGCLWERWHG